MDPVGPPKPKKARGAAASMPETKRPIDVTSEYTNVKDDTESITEMWNALCVEYQRNESKPVCYFRFIIDPRSFGASVENMVDLSFLVQDNRVRVAHDEDGLPVLSPVLEKTSGGSGPSDNGQDESGNGQMIVSLNPDQWKELIELLDIREPMFKPRGREIPEEQSQPTAGTSSENGAN